MNKKNRILLMVSITLFTLSILSFGTYALWTSTDILTDNNTIQSGQVKMSYTESNEIGMNNALPIKDSEGKVLTNYFDFKVLSYIKTKANDNTKRKLNYNIVLEPITVNNPLSDNEMKVYLTKIVDGVEEQVVEPTTIDKLNKYILKSQEEIFSNGKKEVITSYRLRAWIDQDVDTNKLNAKSYSYKFRVNVNNDTAPINKSYALEFAETNKGQNGLEEVTHEIDNTLQVDSRFATEYRYRGGNVNNYVTFNNEVWRIIGIIPTEDDSGNVENRFKIIKDEPVDKLKWNVTEDTATSSYSNWITATLNTYLNTTYYNTLSEEATNIIGTTKYYLGGYNSAGITTDMMWQYERKNNANRTPYYYNVNPIMQNDASKKIALMYVSDYGYAASKSCTRDLNVYNEAAGCTKANNWLNQSKNAWMLAHSGSSSAYIIYEEGDVSCYEYVQRYLNWVRPVLTLSSNVKIISGFGTSSDPYQLSIN